MSEFGRDEKYWSERLNSAKDDIESLLCLTKLENFELKAKIAELQSGVLAQCLAEVMARAGQAGFMAGVECVTTHDQSTIDAAEEYAKQLRQQAGK